MKNTIILLALGAITLSAYSCKKDNPSALYSEEEVKADADNVVDPSTAAAIKFDETTFDFGDVKQEQVVTHYFVFQNVGKSPLVIKEAKPSCGCTVPTKPEKPVAVGAKDSIEVTYTAGTHAGKQQKNVTLVTNTVNGNEIIGFTANVLEGAEKK